MAAAEEPTTRQNRVPEFSEAMDHLQAALADLEPFIKEGMDISIGDPETHGRNWRFLIQRQTQK